MERLNRLLKTLLTWFALFAVVLSLYQSVYKNDISSIVRSDGRGYYAYLPALLIQNDSSFESVVETEKSYGKGAQIYLYKEINGNSYNKYFPGLAVLQSPFFTLACGVSWLSGENVDGYNDIFMCFFLLGSLFYLLIGLISFSKVLEIRFPNSTLSKNAILVTIIVASPVLYYAIHSPCFTHVYSFALFGVFSLLVLKIQIRSSTTLWFLLAITLGFIFLVRPTNILVVLAIPLLLRDFESLKVFFFNLFSRKGKLLVITLGTFISILSLLFISWYWQTGKWIVWSYNGEGFNFLKPKLWDALFSYRIGLYTHTPILLMSLLGLFMFRSRFYELGVYLIYVLLNVWVISSWWCWDYESAFGSRPFTEHIILLFIPAFYFIDKYRRTSYILLSLFTLLGLFRMYQTLSGITPVARYTSSSYWSSLSSFGIDEIGRFNFTKSCEPYGQVIKEEVLLVQEEESFDSSKEYGLSATVNMTKPRTNERYYFSVKLDKKHALERFENVYLIIDATSNDSDERSYSAMNLYNDRNEGYKYWSEKIVFEGIIHDNLQVFDQVKFYIWNQGKIEFSLKNINYKLSVYKN
ncbi:MAG: hypothetical protein MK105_09855 [Crocinitomicaceae bacterium]|nr:hypothetical protein [Crocinitomicaceae bacterium]